MMWWIAIGAAWLFAFGWVLSLMRVSARAEQTAARIRWKIRTVRDLDRVVEHYFPDAAVETLSYRDEIVIYTGWAADPTDDDPDGATLIVPMGEDVR